MAVKEAVKVVLPALCEDLLETVSRKLVESGVDTLEDLKFVEEEDLVDLLKPIQCRKILHAWKLRGKGPLTQHVQYYYNSKKLTIGFGVIMECDILI